MQGRVELRFEAEIQRSGSLDATYIRVPYDIQNLFGKGRLLVHATFDEVPYDGQVVRMVHPDYILRIPRTVCNATGKSFGDSVRVTIRER